MIKSFETMMFILPSFQRNMIKPSLRRISKNSLPLVCNLQVVSCHDCLYKRSMEEKTVKVKKKNKAGPLKSSPGFLKCMRSVYLYFKEEKEKGALNIPINSFIERTAVAYGVGRKTLYNYAKKGLFDEHPKILQQKKKRKKKKAAAVASLDGETRCKPSTPSTESSLAPLMKKRSSRSIQVQTQPAVSIYVGTISNTACVTTSDSSDLRMRELLLKEERADEQRGAVLQEVMGPWASGNSARRDIDYFTKTNIWQNVYSIQSSDVGMCSTELTPSRMGNCQPTSHLTDL